MQSPRSTRSPQASRRRLNPRTDPCFTVLPMEPELYCPFDSRAIVDKCRCSSNLEFARGSLGRFYSAIELRPPSLDLADSYTTKRPCTPRPFSIFSKTMQNRPFLARNVSFFDSGEFRKLSITSNLDGFFADSLPGRGQD